MMHVAGRPQGVQSVQSVQSPGLTTRTGRRVCGARRMLEGPHDVSMKGQLYIYIMYDIYIYM